MAILHNSSTKILEFANKHDVSIFYYSGHGGEGFMAPLPSYHIFGIPTGHGVEYVMSSDIHADTHIAFLNSCSSARSLDFLGAFELIKHIRESREMKCFLDGVILLTGIYRALSDINGGDT